MEFRAGFWGVRFAFAGSAWKVALQKASQGSGRAFLRLLEFLRALTGPCESMQLFEDPHRFSNVLSRSS